MFTLCCSTLRRPRVLFLCLTSVASLRAVHGGSGRGDLLFTNPDARRHHRRLGGPLRGMRHSAHTTAPESGQLHYRRLERHAMGGGPSAGSALFRPVTSDWAYLAASLRRCAEAVGRDGQSLFWYELHQRMPLLEESLHAAQLPQLLDWLHAARCVGVRLSSFAAGRKAGRAARDATPGRHQVYDMEPRLARLTDAVALRACGELARLVSAVAEEETGQAAEEEEEGKGKRRSARRVQRIAELQQRLTEEFQWHGITPPRSFSLMQLTSERNTSGGNVEGNKEDATRHLTEV